MCVCPTFKSFGIALSFFVGFLFLQTDFYLYRKVYLLLTTNMYHQNSLSSVTLVQAGTRKGTEMRESWVFRVLCEWSGSVSCFKSFPVHEEDNLSLKCRFAFQLERFKLSSCGLYRICADSLSTNSWLCYSKFKISFCRKIKTIACDIFYIVLYMYKLCLSSRNICYRKL